MFVRLYRQFIRAAVVLLLLILCANGVIYADTQGPYAPGNIRMSSGSDTGKSSSDGITYIGNPQFQWSKPSDRGTSGTRDFYQWAITSPSGNPWSGTRIREGFTTSTSIYPGDLNNGSYKFWVQAEDYANNWGDWGGVTFTIDYAKPGTPYNLTNPGGASSTSDNTPKVTWSGGTDSGSGVWTYEIFFDGTGGNPDHSYNSGDRTLDDVDYGSSPLQDGSWNWRVRSIDIAGNVSDWSAYKGIIIQTDTQGPYAPGNIRMSSGSDTGKSSSDGITYIGNPQFQWSKPSDRGTSGTRDFYQWAITSPSSDPYSGTRIREGFTTSTSIYPGDLNNGSYKFWVQAEDYANNWGDWGGVIFTIDYTKPGTPYGLTNPGGASSTSDTTPNVTWSGGTDSGSGIWTYEIFFDGTGVNPDHSYNSGDHTLDDVDYGSSPLEEGSWNWTVRSIDIAGNTSDWSGPENIVVGDTTEPTISNWSITNDDSGKVTVQLTASDDTGVKRVRLDYSVGNSSYDRSDWLDWQGGETWEKTLVDTFYHGEQIYMQAWAEDKSANANDITSAYPSNPYLVHYGSFSLTLNINSTAQDIDGFGGSLAMWGYNPDQAALEKVTSELGVTIIRTRGDGAEWKNCLDALLRAKDEGVNKFLLTFWTPPAIGDYKVVGYDGDKQVWKWNASESNYENWSQEIVDKVAEFYTDIQANDSDLEIYVSPQNEPDFSDIDCNHTCMWTPGQLSTLIQRLREKLNLHSDLKDVIIVAPETTNPAEANRFINDMATHPDLFAYHLYGCPQPDLSGLPGLFNHPPNWQTETSGLKNPCNKNDTPDDFEAALYAAGIIHRSLWEANSKAFLWWGLTWHYDTPESPPEFDRQQGLVLVDHYQNPMSMVTNGITKKYYAFKHYSKFVKPKYKRINLPAVFNVSQLKVSAFKSPGNREVVLVIVNLYEQDINFNILGLAAYNLSQAVRTDSQVGGCRQLDPGEWTGMSGMIPGKTITTLVYTNPAINHAPILSNPGVQPNSGSPGTGFYFYVNYYDQDGDLPGILQCNLEGPDNYSAAFSATLDSGSPTNGMYKTSPVQLTIPGDYHFQWWASDTYNAEVFSETVNGPVVGSNTAFIRLTSPNGGEQWQMGTPRDIIWTYQGVTGDAIIQLYKSNSLYREIGTAPVNNESFSWNIPNDLPAGTDYQVRIYQGNIEDYSDNDFSIVSLSPFCAFPDFNMDGQGDVIWRYDAPEGYNALWLMGTNGATSTAAAAYSNKITPAGLLARMNFDTSERISQKNVWESVETFWTGTVKDGFSGQTHWNNSASSAPDTFVVNNKANQNMSRIMVSSVTDPRNDPQSVELLAVADQNWKIAGTGDFNGDGKIDIVWSNVSTAHNCVWYMDGTTFAGYGRLPDGSTTDWVLGGVGDFDLDGHPDLIWHNEVDGRNGMWYLDGLQLKGIDIMTTGANVDWKLCGTGDFNSDGQVDLVWRNINDGRNAVWYMDGVELSSVGWLDAVADQNWKLRGTGDFDGNGKTDLIWTNISDGHNCIWKLDGVTLTGVEFLTTVTDTTWIIEN
jgi:O-glycosyl hydrolase